MYSEITCPKPIELPSHFFEFSESLRTSQWMSHRPGRLLDNIGQFSDSSVVFRDTYQDAINNILGSQSTKNINQIHQELAALVKPQLGENSEDKFEQMWSGIKNQASHLFGVNCNISHNSDITMQAESRFVYDALSYYFYTHYSPNTANANRAKRCWEIWRCGFGVAGENSDFRQTTFYCYKRLY